MLAQVKELAGNQERKVSASGMKRKQAQMGTDENRDKRGLGSGRCGGNWHG